MRKGDLTSLTFDEEQTEIDGEPAPDDRTLLGEADDDDDGTGNLPPGGGNEDEDEAGDDDEE
jgi:hypothetical protein